MLKKIINISVLVSLTFGATVCAVSLLAPYLGLGERETFILYDFFGWERRSVFNTGTIFFLWGGIILLIRFSVNLVGKYSSRKTNSLVKPNSNPADNSSTSTLGATFGIVFISLLVGVFVFEIYHRFELAGRIQDKISNSYLWIHSNSLHSDPNNLDNYLKSFNKTPKGGQFRASSRFDLSIVHEKRGSKNFTVRTNAHGLLSEKEYVEKRDPKNPEYRVAVLGDSFTGPTTATYQWVDTIEDLLNANSELKELFPNVTFKTYNFGWIGAGFQTFWKEFNEGARHFDPDLVIINYIEKDFPRADGKHFSDNTEMVLHAKKHVQKIFDAHDNFLVTLMPVYSDFDENLDSGIAGYKTTEMLEKEYPPFKPVRMRALMPVHLGKVEIASWFNIPHDAHYSDRGGEIYARVLSALISEKITGKRLDFSTIETQHSDMVTGSSKPNLRQIRTSVSYLSESPERINSIKSFIKNKMWEGRIFSTYPYSWNMLTGKGSDGLETPPTEPHSGTFVNVPYGADENEYVKLNIVCLLKEVPIEDQVSDWNLTNPECKHYFHIYAKRKE